MVGILVSFGDLCISRCYVRFREGTPLKMKDHSKPLSSKHHFSRGKLTVSFPGAPAAKNIDTSVRQTSKFHCFTAKSTEPSEIFLKCCCACHQFDNSLELISLYCGNSLESIELITTPDLSKLQIMLKF